MSSLRSPTVESSWAGQAKWGLSAALRHRLHDAVTASASERPSEPCVEGSDLPSADQHPLASARTGEATRLLSDAASPSVVDATISLRHVAAFLAVIDTGSYRDAARLLHYSEPGVHHQVQSLERQLGLRLFVRVGRSVELSGDGERIAPYCRSILNATLACLAISRARPGSDGAGVGRDTGA